MRMVSFGAPTHLFALKTVNWNTSTKPKCSLGCAKVDDFGHGRTASRTNIFHTWLWPYGTQRKRVLIHSAASWWRLCTSSFTCFVMKNLLITILYQSLSTASTTRSSLESHRYIGMGMNLQCVSHVYWTCADRNRHPTPTFLSSGCSARQAALLHMSCQRMVIRPPFMRRRGLNLLLRVQILAFELERDCVGYSISTMGIVSSTILNSLRG